MELVELLQVESSLVLRYLPLPSLAALGPTFLRPDP